MFTDHSTFAITSDLKNGMARTDWDRVIQFPAVTHDVYSEIVTPEGGYADVAGSDLVINQSDLPPKGPAGNVGHSRCGASARTRTKLTGPAAQGHRSHARMAARTPFPSLEASERIHDAVAPAA